MKNLFKILLSLMIAAAIALPATFAFANVAANTAITNTARLTFTGGSANATVTVTVALVPSQPNVTISYAAAAYTSTDTPTVNDSVVITATANGQANYTIAPTVLASTNTTAPSVTGGVTVPIGATVTTGTSGTTYVTVPAGALNGIGNNSVIVFTVNTNTYQRTVTGTTDNGDGTFRISWTTGILLADVPGAGVQVGEQKTVNLTVKPGTVLTPGVNITVRVQAVVSTPLVSDTTVSNTVANPNTWTTPSPGVSMTKYVRNLLAAGNAAGTGSTSFTINSFTNNYFTGNVTGKPGDTLEYVIVAQNTGGADLTSSAISDLIPTAYVNFATGVYGVKDVFYIAPVGDVPATNTFSAGAVGANQASFVAANNPNLIVNVGTGATNLLTGTIAVGKSVTIAYQVVIK